MRLAWHDFIFDLPDGWEITRYATAQPAGRLEFFGRGGFFGKLSWETTTKFPDEKRTLTEYHRRYLSRHYPDRLDGFRGIETVAVGKFLVGFRAPDEPCQAMTLLEPAGMVLLWLFPAYSRERLQTLWRPLLESFRSNDGAWREWGAFGIRCRLPAAFDLEDAVCKPADAWLGFETQNLHRVDIHRWGLPRELLRGRTLETFIRSILLGHEGRLLEGRPEDWRGMESLALTFEVRGRRGMDRLYAARWQGTGRVWHDRQAKRLHAWLQAAPRRVTLLSEDQVLSP